MDPGNEAQGYINEFLDNLEPWPSSASKICFYF